MSERRLLGLARSRPTEANEPFKGGVIAAGELWWVLNKSQPCTVPVGGVWKRSLDVVVATLALVLLAPLMIAIAAAIRLSMGGPVLFGHGRIGHNGRTFRCYKFRTMVVGADKILQEYLSANPQAAKEWRETQKLRKDPRITFVGHVLRKTSLDELPQLVNILRGEMSCVGPRPIVADELAHYGEFAPHYLRARPGLTGAWQVSGRTSLKYAERVALDVDYVRKWSLWKDVGILLKTIPAVMRVDNAS
jgi:exopolysaccharide production protein ExoY